MLDRQHSTIDDDSLIGGDFVGEAPSPSGRIDAEALLVRALVQEVHIAALIAAGATGAVNVATTPRGPRALSEARGLIVDFRARLDNWPRRILEDYVEVSTLEDISGFYALFNDARGRLLGFEREAISIGLDRAGPLHLRSLTTAWRLTCRHGLAAATALTSEAESLLPPSYAANLVTLDSLLDDVLKGGAKLCDEHGTITLPNLAERRRTPRRSLLQTAHVRCGNSDFIAFVKDVSLGGVGLARVPKLPEGEPLVVELSCGRVLRGHVAWQRGENAGIRFERQLRPTDPLLFG